MSPRQVFSVFLLIVVIMVILYPTTATGTVRIDAKYEQAVIEVENPKGLLIIKGVTNFYVSFSEIRIHSASEGNETGWLPISFGTGSVDLTDLENKLGTIFTTPTVPVGEYNSIMLNVANTTTIVNGTTLQVETVPRFLVINYPFTVKADSETI